MSRGTFLWEKNLSENDFFINWVFSFFWAERNRNCYQKFFSRLTKSRIRLSSGTLWFETFLITFFWCIFLDSSWQTFLAGCQKLHSSWPEEQFEKKYFFIIFCVLKVVRLWAGKFRTVSQKLIRRLSKCVVLVHGKFMRYNFIILK